MALTPEQRHRRMMETAACYAPLRYQKKYIQPDFNLMIRAEAGAFVGEVPAVVGGIIKMVYSPIGCCVCVTCGKVLPWTAPRNLGATSLDAGHFLQGDRIGIIETNCHPQCGQRCNRHGSGESADYLVYMLYRYGQDEVDRLRAIKGDKKYQPPPREELVWKRIGFMDRAAAAEKKMQGVT